MEQTLVLPVFCNDGIPVSGSGRLNLPKFNQINAGSFRIVIPYCYRVKHTGRMARFAGDLIGPDPDISLSA